MANSKKRKKILIFTVILLVIAGLSAFAIFRKREIVITIQTDKVARRNLTELVRANGRIQPVVQVKISPEVSGEIIELPVKEGQQVKKGDLILKIKPDFYIASRNQAEAGYKGSLAGQSHLRGEAHQSRSGIQTDRGPLQGQAGLRIRFSTKTARATPWPKRKSLSAEHQVEIRQGHAWPARRRNWPRPPSSPPHRHDQQAELGTRANASSAPPPWPAPMS